MQRRIVKNSNTGMLHASHGAVDKFTLCGLILNNVNLKTTNVSAENVDLITCKRCRNLMTTEKLELAVLNSIHKETPININRYKKDIFRLQQLAEDNQ